MFYTTDLHTLPEVSMMGRVTQKPGYTSVQNRIPENILILLRDGDMRFTLNGRDYSLFGNDWLLLPKGSSYHLTTRGGCTYSYTHFRLALPFTVPEEPLQKERAPRSASFPYALPVGERTHCIFLPFSGHLRGEEEKIWTLLTECDMQRLFLSPPRKLRIDLYFAEILSILDARGGTGAENEYPAILSSVLRSIHEHCREGITLSSLCKTFRLSPQYLMRLFRKHLNTTVTQYITVLRMSHALELLRQPGFRVCDVADMLGYQNTYYFCRLFKRQFGMTPTEYARHAMASYTAEKQTPQT